MRRYYCNCCGCDFAPRCDEIDVECPNCGAAYDPDDESYIEAYNGEEDENGKT